MDDFEEIDLRIDYFNELNALVGDIFAAVMNVTDDDKIASLWYDCRVYGDDPVFTAMLFDRMIAEAEEKA